jgi:type III restriction enzyme
LKQALIDTGVYVDEDKLENRRLRLKPAFKETGFYQNGRVFYNKKVEKDFRNISSLDDLGVKRKNYTYQLTSGFGKVSSAFFELEQEHEAGIQKKRDMKLTEIPRHIIRFALTQHPFFYFANIVRYFPGLDSLSRFIERDNYLGGLVITFRGTPARLEALTHLDYLYAVRGLLEALESEIKSNITNDFI